MNASVSKPALVQQNYLLSEFASIRVHSRLKRLFQSAHKKQTNESNAPLRLFTAIPFQNASIAALPFQVLRG
jgi:hypothetical protein